MNDAVPTWTAAAPMARNSSASRPFMMPPDPITGIDTARTASWQRASASGLMAGPDSPPVARASFDARAIEIDRHADERVHRGERVGASLLARDREVADRRHVGRQLGDERRARERAQARERRLEPARVRPVARAAASRRSGTRS